jgi:outer membrane lipoprotein SlyB
MFGKFKFSALLAMPLLAGCVGMPTGPSMLVLPGTGKSFDQFRNDDYSCRQFAYQQVGGVTPTQAAVSSGVASAAIGTALGAAAGAAIGGGQGAAVGAGTGLVAGGLVGTGTAQASGYEAQQRYDMSYLQCMYASGHKVPVVGQFKDDSPSSGEHPNASIPPPPPGTPPPQ